MNKGAKFSSLKARRLPIAAVGRWRHSSQIIGSWSTMVYSRAYVCLGSFFMFIARTGTCSVVTLPCKVVWNNLVFPALVLCFQKKKPIRGCMYHPQIVYSCLTKSEYHVWFVLYFQERERFVHVIGQNRSWLIPKLYCFPKPGYQGFYKDENGYGTVTRSLISQRPIWKYAKGIGDSSEYYHASCAEADDINVKPKLHLLLPFSQIFITFVCVCVCVGWGGVNMQTNLNGFAGSKRPFTN